MTNTPGNAWVKHLRAGLLAGAGVFVLAALATGITNRDADAQEFGGFAVGNLDAFPDNSAPARAPAIVDPGPDAPIRIQSDRLTHDRNTGLAIATGDVVIQHGPYVLMADQVTYNPRTEQMTADGNVYFYEPNGNVVRAQHMVMSDQFRRGFVEYLRATLTNEAWIEAQNAERLDGNVNVFYDVTYSRCNECVGPDGEPLWVVHSDVVTHDQDAQTIYHENATLELLGVPVFYSPYLEHPDPTVNKRSGFLLPNIRTSGELGVGIEVPYFFNLAPHYDLTLRPTFTTRQGVLMEADWRHRLDFLNGEYDLSVAGVYQLRPSEVAPGDVRFRGSIESNGLFSINNDWYWGWAVNAASDDTFMRAYDIDGRTDLISQGFLVGLSGRNYFDARAYHFKGLLAADNNSTIPYALPAIEHSYYFGDPLLGGELSLDTHIYNLQRSTGADSSRVVTEVNWQRRRVNNAGIVVTPFAGVRGDVYVTDNVPDTSVPGGVRGSETVARVFPHAGIDVRWPFIQVSGSTQQIFEPVAQVITSTNETNTGQIPNEDSLPFEYDVTNLFLSSKFNGIDRVEGGTRANVGFNNTFLFENGAFIRTTVGESFHIAGENSFAAGTGLDTWRSDFIAGVAFQPIPNIRLASLTRFDEETFSIQRHDLSVNAYYGGLSVAANYTDLVPSPVSGRLASEEQISASAVFTLAQYWQVFGAYRYDIQNDRNRTRLAGLRFLCECFTAELVYKEDFVGDRDADPDRSLIFNVIFTTLGGGGYSQSLE
jgi:LPS-assembly protein